MRKILLFLSFLLIYELNSQGIVWQPVGNVGGTVFTFGLDSSNNIFAGAYNSILKSTDDGRTWVRKLTGGQYTNFLAFAVNKQGHIITTTHTPQMYRSTDKGESWKAFSPMPYQDYRPLIYLPNGDLITAPHNRGLFRSKDDGNKWEKVEGGLNASIIWSVAVSSDGLVYAGTNNFLFVSRDTGYTWEQIKYDDYCSGARTVFITSDGAILIGSEITVVESKVYNCGIFKSTDGGKTWEKAFYGLDTNFYRSVISFVEPIPGVIFVGTNEWGVYRSIDNGNSCHKVSDGLEDVSFLWFLFQTKSGNLLAGTNKGIFQTTASVTKVEMDDYSKETHIIISNGTLILQNNSQKNLDLFIYDLLGRKLKEIPLGYLILGENKFENVFSGLGNGLFIIQIRSEKGVETYKIFLQD